MNRLAPKPAGDEGDISVDELETAMKARREQWKMHGSGGSAVTPPP